MEVERALSAAGLLSSLHEDIIRSRLSEATLDTLCFRLPVYVIVSASNLASIAIIALTLHLHD